MDTNIPLMGLQINPAAAMQNGLAAGVAAQTAQRQNALTQLYQTQGPGIMAGNPAALNSLAQFDPAAAVSIQSQQLGMQAQRSGMELDAERIRVLRDEAKRAAAAEAAKMSAEQRAAEAAQLNTVLRGAAAMYSAGDQARYNAFLQAQGVDPAQYPFEQFPAFAAMGDGVLEAMTELNKLNAPPAPMSPEGKLYADLNAGLITPEAYETASRPKGPMVVNNLGGESAFDKKLGETDATTISGATDAGLSARRSLIQVSQLERLLETTPTGATGFFVQAAGRLGLAVDGVDDVQAATALISSLVPAQRPPGSGTMSDADLELFKQSLPSIMNQPGGNAKIINTIKAIAQYDMEGANIALRARLPDGDPMHLSRADVLKELQSRQNPLEGLGLGIGAASPPTGAGQVLRFDAQGNPIP